MHTIELTHTTETGHRIPSHEGGNGKCARLHGHSYSFKVQLASLLLDEHGFVVDFGAIKRIIDEWDHRLILWDNDVLTFGLESNPITEDLAGVLRVPFVPTAENMAQHLAERFVTEFDHVSFAVVEVRETQKSVARYHCSHNDVKQPMAEPVTLVKAPPWPGERR